MGDSMKLSMLFIYLLDWHSESIAYDVNKLLSVTLFLDLLE